MVLKFISLKNFRRHQQSYLEFSDKLNFIIGGNGQGKTTILESIYYLCTTKSDSAKSDSEAVNFNETEFEINGLFKDLTENRIRIYFSQPGNKKYYFRDDKQIHRSSDIIGKFPVVLLTPADHSITQGSPSERRKFVDSVVSQASEIYLSSLLDYNRVLRQRSSLLYQIRETRKGSLADELDAWTEKLISSGTKIINYRLKFIAEFQSYLKESYNIILNNEESPDVLYWYFENNNCDNNIQDEFRRLLKLKREEEIRRATNLIGPHRDDFIFSVNGINLKTYGSQGQHKTFQVVLRFAEFFYLKNKTNISPIFLLDDVFGELDINRSLKISEYLRSVGQAFITLTNFTNISFLKRDERDKYFELKDGIVNYA